MHIQHQHTCICHPYTPLLYMYIAPIYTINIYVHSTNIHNQYTCIYHPYIQSIYMHISSIYTINIYAHSTHIHNKYTCIQHPYIPSIYIYYNMAISISVLVSSRDSYISPRRQPSADMGRGIIPRPICYNLFIIYLTMTEINKL